MPAAVALKQHHRLVKQAKKQERREAEESRRREEAREEERQHTAAIMQVNEPGLTTLSQVGSVHGIWSEWHHGVNGRPSLQSLFFRAGCGYNYIHNKHKVGKKEAATYKKRWERERLWVFYAIALEVRGRVGEWS